MAIKIFTDSIYGQKPKILIQGENVNEKDLEKVDFEYDNGYGGQELFGMVLFNDNTWLSRGEYDGSEWWDYNEPPKVEDVLNY